MKRKQETNQAITPDITLKQEKKSLFSHITWWPLPPLVSAVVLITTLGILLQLLNPALFLALRRDPTALSRGEWWRVITPLLVNDGSPIFHFVLDTAGFLLVGTVTERLFGAGRWLLLFFAGAAAGTIVGYLWDPYGAGTSIALCGLIGGLVIWQIRTRDFHLFSSLYAFGLTLVLACEAVIAAWVSNTLVGMLILAVICCVGGNVLWRLHKRQLATRLSAFFVGGSVLLCSLILLVMRDIHGVALLTGLVSATLILWHSSKHPATVR